LLSLSAELPTSLSNTDKETLRRELVERSLVDWMVHDHVAFRQVESEHFRRFLKAISENHEKYIPSSHSTIKSLVLEAFTVKQSAIKEQIKLAKSEIHLSFDLWTTPQRTKSVLGIVAHYLGPDWSNTSHLLALRHLEGTHSGENMAPIVLDVIKQYEIDATGFFVLDNARSNDTAVRHVLASLRADPSEYSFRRLRCLGHIINLVANAFLFGSDAKAFENDDWDDLEAAYELWQANGPVALVKYIVVFIRASDQRRAAFDRLQAKPQTLQALKNNKTRWNSTFAMLRRALVLREAIDLFCMQFIKTGELDPKARIDDDTWALLERICEMLEHFNTATLQFQGHAKEGHHGALWEVLPSIENLIDEMEKLRAQYPFLRPQERPMVSRGKKATVPVTAPQPSNVQFLAVAVNNAWAVLDKYYNLTDQSTAYVLAVVLNPQYKWAFFDGSWALRPEWLNTAKTKVQALWDDYKERHLGSQAGPQVMPVAVSPKPDYSKPQPLTAYMNRMAARPTRPVTIADDYERWIVDDPVEVEEGVVFNQLGW
jgi:hypothetical protein